MFFLDFSQTVPKTALFSQMQGTGPSPNELGKNLGKHATLYSHKACLYLNNNKEILLVLKCSSKLVLFDI